MKQRMRNILRTGISTLVPNTPTWQNTLDGLRESVGDSDRVKNLLLTNLTTQEKTELQLNLVWLTYDFDLHQVLVEYYVIDNNYPNIRMSFEDFRRFINGQEPHPVQPKSD